MGDILARTDRNNNPCAFTTEIAAQAGLAPGKEYERGDSFQAGSKTLYTARLIGDPVALSIRVIDKLGYYTKSGSPRWVYIAIPAHIWQALSPQAKRYVIGFHYGNEGGRAMREFFPDNFPVDAGPK